MAAAAVAAQALIDPDNGLDLLKARLIRERIVLQNCLDLSQGPAAGALRQLLDIHAGNGDLDALPR